MDHPCAVKNRSSMEIRDEILERAMSGTTRTEIILQVALTTVQAERYLELLKTHELVQEIRRHVYRITERGMAYLCKSNEARDLMAQDEHIG